MIEGKVSIILLKVETAESVWQVLNMIEKKKEWGQNRKCHSRNQIIKERMGAKSAWQS